MIVYHGTGLYNLDGLKGSKPRCEPRQYLKGRRAFATTTDFNIAALFALRRSPPAALRDEREMGVVLEYEIATNSRQGRDWTPAKCSGVLQDEQEIAVLNPAVLELVAVWRQEGGSWMRHALAHECAEKVS